VLSIGSLALSTIVVSLLYIRTGLDIGIAQARQVERECRCWHVAAWLQERYNRRA